MLDKMPVKSRATWRAFLLRLPDDILNMQQSQQLHMFFWRIRCVVDFLKSLECAALKRAISLIFESFKLLLMSYCSTNHQMHFCTGKLMKNRATIVSLFLIFLLMYLKILHVCLLICLGVSAGQSLKIWLKWVTAFFLLVSAFTCWILNCND